MKEIITDFSTSMVCDWCMDLMADCAICLAVNVMKAQPRWSKKQERQVYTGKLFKQNRILQAMLKLASFKIQKMENSDKEIDKKQTHKQCIYRMSAILKHFRKLNPLIILKYI